MSFGLQRQVENGSKHSHGRMHALRTLRDPTVCRSPPIMPSIGMYDQPQLGMHGM